MLFFAYILKGKRNASLGVSDIKPNFNFNLVGLSVYNIPALCCLRHTEYLIVTSLAKAKQLLDIFYRRDVT